MDWVVIGLVAFLSVFLPWAWESFMRLRVRVARLERATGTGKRDLWAEAAEDADPSGVPTSEAPLSPESQLRSLPPPEESPVPPGSVPRGRRK